MEWKKCGHCGNSFMAETAIKKFCRIDCARKYSMAHTKPKPEKVTDLPGWEARNCLVCKGKFRFRTRRGRKPAYCSTCVATHTTKTRRACDRST